MLYLDKDSLICLLLQPLFSTLSPFKVGRANLRANIQQTQSCISILSVLCSPDECKFNIQSWIFVLRQLLGEISSSWAPQFLKLVSLSVCCLLLSGLCTVNFQSYFIRNSCLLPATIKLFCTPAHRSPIKTHAAVTRCFLISFEANRLRWSFVGCNNRVTTTEQHMLCVSKLIVKQSDSFRLKKWMREVKAFDSVPYEKHNYSL